MLNAHIKILPKLDKDSISFGAFVFIMATLFDLMYIADGFKSGEKCQIFLIGVDSELPNPKSSLILTTSLS